MSRLNQPWAKIKQIYYTSIRQRERNCFRQLSLVMTEILEHCHHRSACLLTTSTRCQSQVSPNICRASDSIDSFIQLSKNCAKNPLFRQLGCKITHNFSIDNGFIINFLEISCFSCNWLLPKLPLLKLCRTMLRLDGQYC